MGALIQARNGLVYGLVAVLALAGCSMKPAESPVKTLPATASVDMKLADQVRDIVTEQMGARHLRSVLVRVTIAGEPVITEAFGESMPGVPARTDMHFRNGAVAISYMATALLQLVDEEKVSLADKLSNWLPGVPNSDKVTLGQLVQMTSGYEDYVPDDEFEKAFYADPFRSWTPEELQAFGTSKPLIYEPGTNWNYAHTNYVLLGLALEKIAEMPLDELLQEKILTPLGLTGTRSSDTPEIPEPVLHAYTGERRDPLGLPATANFIEDSSFWNPSWTLARGAVQTTTITDMTTSADAIGSGSLLSAQSHAAQIDTSLRGKTTKVPGCINCTEMGVGFSYGLGVVLSGNWVLQNPMFGGYSAVEASLPSEKIAIAVAVTYNEAAFDDPAGVPNQALELFKIIGAQAAPADAPPTSR
ncbi:serine hydrolase domain-containing protein [Arthrobacter glacialis]|uniref:D-alanyl-D-alanine carboxypeptidase n=1 Tax=Arthrobacter glacialis TaxID=1664 RepID=A0A2S3ZW82_ARTGL|nr:serine hydrolase domain-containing protein [Arthrobacter glacialis]POH73525.1 D-alanyl-D-alanine carboxypeptidase [Arthrobacter glacialis]